MKGIVMEVNENTMFLLTDSGEFKEVKRPKENLIVGHEYNSKNYSFSIDYNIFRSRKLAIIMLAVLLMIPTTLSYTYFQPHGYINIDINPSVEITYNVFNRVIDIKSINDDGIKIIEDDLDIDNMKIEDAVEKIIIKAEKLGFISESKENLVLITVTSKNRKDSLKYEGESFKSDEYEVEVIKANKEEHSEAVKQGISTAKVVLDKMIKEENSEDKKEKLQKIYEKFDGKFKSDEREDSKLNNEDRNIKEEQLEKTEKIEEKAVKESERLKKIEEIKKKKEEERLEKIEELRKEKEERKERLIEEKAVKESERLKKIEEAKIERDEELAKKRKVEREEEDVLRKKQLEKSKKEKELEKIKKENLEEGDDESPEEKEAEKSKDNQKGGNNKKD